jgi:UDP-N-acetylglucosamine 2-epimerase
LTLCPYTRSSDLFVTGNTVIDALLWVRERLSTLEPARVKDLFSNTSGVSDQFLDLITSKAEQPAPIVLITGHRRENFGQGFEQIIRAIEQLAEAHKNTHFVYPVHLNPHVQGPVYDALSGYENVHLLAPLDYAPFVYLMDRARLVLTDSGGIQEEAPSLGKPVLVMRETTERPEAIEAGTARLVGTDTERIVREVTRLLNDNRAHAEMAEAQNPFGDGTAAHQTVAHLQRWHERKNME